MKLRLDHNAVRLRLNMIDMETLVNLGKVSECVAFPRSEDGQFTYTVRCVDEGCNIDISLGHSGILVSVPRNQALAWARGDEVGFERTFPLGSGAQLQVLVEKDFKCRSRDRDDAHSFSNPLEEAGHRC